MQFFYTDKTPPGAVTPCRKSTRVKGGKHPAPFVKQAVYQAALDLFALRRRLLMARISSEL